MILDHRLLPPPLRRFAAKLRRGLEAFEADPDAPREPGWTFHAKLTPDELDGGWTAECLELPGCISDGDTQAEALQNLTDAIAEVIAVRLESHLPSVGHDDEQQDRELALTV